MKHMNRTEHLNYAYACALMHYEDGRIGEPLMEMAKGIMFNIGAVYHTRGFDKLIGDLDYPHPPDPCVPTNSKYISSAVLKYLPYLLNYVMNGLPTGLYQYNVSVMLINIYNSCGGTSVSTLADSLELMEPRLKADLSYLFLGNEVSGKSLAFSLTTISANALPEQNLEWLVGIINPNSGVKFRKTRKLLLAASNLFYDGKLPEIEEELMLPIQEGFNLRKLNLVCPKEEREFIYLRCLYYSLSKTVSPILNSDEMSPNKALLNLLWTDYCKRFNLTNHTEQSLNSEFKECIILSEGNYLTSCKIVSKEFGTSVYNYLDNPPRRLIRDFAKEFKKALV